MNSYRGRFIFFALIFVALSVWGLLRLNVFSSDPGSALISEISAKAWILLLVSFVCIYLVDALRYYVFARALGFSIQFRPCIRASVLNFLFSWLSPGGVLGAPAASFELKKTGIPYSTGLIICFGKSIFGSAMILGASLCILILAKANSSFPASGLAALGGWEEKAFLIVALAYLPLLILIPMGVFFPKFSTSIFRRRIEQNQGRVGKMIWTTLLSIQEKLNFLFQNGKMHLVLALLSSLVYLIILSVIGTILSSEFGAKSFLAAFSSSLLFSSFSYMMPTPSGAGLAEVASGSFFNGILEISKIGMVVFWMRFFCFYLQILVGLAYLFFVVGPKALTTINSLQVENREN